MRYSIVIEPGTETTAFGVVIPDLPGCFSAGDTLSEAITNAQEAAVGWIETELAARHAIPAPSAAQAIAALPEYRGWLLDFVEVPDSLLSPMIH